MKKRSVDTQQSGGSEGVRQGPPTVYVVHCVDTEGPLAESLDSTFERIRQIFGVELEPTRTNLLRLQRGEMELGERTEAVRKLVDPRLMTLNTDWAEIDAMLDRVMSPAFRAKHPDSGGRGWVYNWFCVDHVGYLENPRKRAIGHHVVMDYYAARLQNAENRDDGLFFHYHPLPYNRKAHSCATFYFNDNHLFEILARKVIDRQWFPAVFRPGFHTTRPDSHWFLEQWIPFDFANQATAVHVDQPDLGKGRFGDWRRAPRIWGAYHPHHDDYQVEGACRRWIFRCLNMEARLREISQDDVDDAFGSAAEKGKSVLAFADHDFRDMAPEVEKVYSMIRRASEKNSGVRFEHANALDAARQYLNLSSVESLGLEIHFSNAGPDAIEMSVRTAHPIFGPQPFLAVRDSEGSYFYDNLDRGEDAQHWRYVFDWQTFLPACLDRVGLAASGPAGQVEVLVHDFKSNTTSRSVQSIPQDRNAGRFA